MTFTVSQCTITDAYIVDKALADVTVAVIWYAGQIFAS